MIKSQKKIFQLVLIFSVLINIMLLGVLFFVIRNFISGSGDYLMPTKSLWFFVGIIGAYGIANVYFLLQVSKKSDDVTKENTIQQ